VTFLQKGVEKLPEHPEVRYHLGMAQFKKGETGQAKKTLETALKLSPNFQGADQAKATLQTLASR
jgi:Tfp pilus assembly protein PilF